MSKKKTLADELIDSAFPVNAHKHESAMSIMKKMPMLRAGTTITAEQLAHINDSNIENTTRIHLGKVVGEYVAKNCVSIEDLANGDKKAEVSVFILSEAQVMEYLLAAIDAPKA